MQVCPQCFESFEVPHEYASGQICPACEAEPDLTAEQGWKNAARIKNLAEAGYLVSLLGSRQIDARLIESNSFSATDGSWNHSYMLQVAADQIETAMPILQAESHAADDEDEERLLYADDDQPLPLVIWRPVALLALAGVATLWMGNQWIDTRPRDAPARGAEKLTSALQAVDRPFVATDARGQARHRLQYNANARAWWLDTDVDGDGTFEIRQAFPQAEPPN